MLKVDTLLGRAVVENINPLLTAREAKRYANLIRSVDTMLWCERTYPRVRAILSWVFGLRRFERVGFKFDDSLKGWFTFNDGTVPEELSAGLIRLACSYRSRLIWSTRVAMLLSICSAVAFFARVGEGSFSPLYLLALLLAVLGTGVLVVVRTSFLSAIGEGSWWSINDSKFLATLRQYGDDFTPGRHLKVALQGVSDKSGLGLSGGGYSILASLAGQWELSFTELLETTHGLSI